MTMTPASAWAIVPSRCPHPTERMTSISSLGYWDNKGYVPALLYSWGRPETKLQETGCYGFLECNAIEIAF